MAARGEVLALRRAVGFLPNARLERFVVVQVDAITRVTETVIVAPLDEAVSVYNGMPGALPVTAAEAGTTKKQVAVLMQLATLPLDRFEPIAAGKLRPSNLLQLDGILRLILAL